MNAPGQHRHVHDELKDHDLGLAHDLPRLARAGLGRRGMLGILGGVGVVAVAGCARDSETTTPSGGGGGPDGGPPEGDGGGGSAVEVAEGEIPEETAGPFPGDGSNGPNILTESGVVRQNITSSFGNASGVAHGVPLTVRLKVYDLAGEQVTPLAGAAVYLWHCDRDGNYSMYSEAVAEENYLRGVQEAAADGTLAFTTIFPACYPGRWPHIHFEVYESLDAATSASTKLRTSQLAFPQDVCESAYGSAEGYQSSVENLAEVSLDSDNVFSDGYSLQLATVTGSVEEGYTAVLNVPV